MDQATLSSMVSSFIFHADSVLEIAVLTFVPLSMEP